MTRPRYTSPEMITYPAQDLSAALNDARREILDELEADEGKLAPTDRFNISMSGLISLAMKVVRAQSQTHEEFVTRFVMMMSSLSDELVNNDRSYRAEMDQWDREPYL